MRIELNGSPAELPPGSRVADALALAGVAAVARGVAVAVDGEVVQAVQGG